MVIDFSEMPFPSGLSNGFDGAAGASADGWENQIGGTDFILQNAECSDGIVTLSGDNIGYLPISEPDEYTAYFLCKTAVPETSTSSGQWGQVFGCRNGDNRCYVGVSTYSGTPCKMRTYSSSSSVVLDTWRLIAVRRTSGYYYVYADGVMIMSETNTYTARGDKFMIKSITTAGTAPTVDESITVSMRCCIICDEAHTEAQVKLNSEWLLVHYQLASAPLESKMSGADAAAIAWVIARNLEQSNMLAAVKTAYRKGLTKGSDTEEPWETGDDTIDLPTDEDGVVADDEKYIDLNKGISMQYQNPDDPTDCVTVRIFLDHSKDGAVAHPTTGRTVKNGKGLLSYEISGSITQEAGACFIELVNYTAAYHVETNTDNPDSYPRYFTEYKIVNNGTYWWVEGYSVSPSLEGWADASTNDVNIRSGYWTIPDRYVYVGAKNI